MSAQIDLKGLVQEAKKRLSQRKIVSYLPYGHPDAPEVRNPWQIEFHNSTATQRLVMAGNRSGKTYCGAAEMTYHLTGDYPEWWEGHRFEEPITAWACSITNETSRDIQQKELLGQPHGTGMIPKDSIEKVTWRQAGVSNVADKCLIRHKSGGFSTLVFKTYDQGWRKYQGTSIQVIWMDEEPDDMKIFSECLLRILDCDGMIYITFTPLMGETDLVRHFLHSNIDGVEIFRASWDDAPHLGDNEREQILASVPEFERDARSKGIPMLGSGRIYPVRDEDLLVEPFQIPGHFFQIVGIDFGVDHPAAGVWLAIDRDKDIVYVTDCYKQSGQDAVYHSEAIKSRGRWIPVAWPHDGFSHEKGTGVMLKDHYVKHGVNMLSKHASYKDDRGNKREPGIMEILEYMRTGRFKVFKHLTEFMQEIHGYHRDERGNVVKKHDDLMDALRYAFMMRRYAMQQSYSGHKPTYTGPVVSWI